jgi:pre-mRNA cleavage complex 2 protein Pcf11
MFKLTWIDADLQTRPEYKFAAFMVLDSLIRNVGPPYSTYLGKNLFNTFMGAYRQVNDGVRREMESVLRTWKEPVPGLRDTRPILEQHVTQDIENALNKFRAVMGQTQIRPQSIPQSLPGMYQAPGVPYRNSPVQMGQQMQRAPSGGHPNYATPNLGAFAASQMQQRTATPPTYPHLQPNVIRSPLAGMLQQGQPSYQSTPDYGAASQTSQLTTASVKQEADSIRQSLLVQQSLGSQDPELPKIISTLDKVNGLLSTQHLDQAALGAIKGQLAALSRRTQEGFNSIMGQMQGTTAPSAPNHSASQASYPLSFPPSISTPPPILPHQGSANTAGLPPSMLISLLTQQSGSTPLPPPPQPGQAPAEANGFLQQLRAAGLLLGTPTPDIGEAGKSSRYGVYLNQDSITKV